MRSVVQLGFSDSLTQGSMAEEVNPDFSSLPSPVSEEEPQPDNKKPKMSPPDEISNAAGVASEGECLEFSESNKKQRYKRRKVAIVFGYCGVGYQGMQKNPGAKTIEGELEEALYRCGAVPEHDRGKPQRYDWARSARTDKGVSAVGQVVSGRFYVDPPCFVERLNSQLPDQIRVFGFKRVTASFSAKKFCDRRRYVYLIPVFALDPSSHRDRESVLASLGSENELVKCLECSERGRKVVGAVGNKRDVPSPLISKDEEGSPFPAEVTPTSNGKDCHEKTAFKYVEETREKFNRILGEYVGSHNFHNFTTRTKAEDPSAIRYIISFTAQTTVEVEGIEFVKCQVLGQSFMLHQIRKMMGLAVAIMRGCASEALLQTALRKDVNVNIPTAPEVGLYLEECLFSSYNEKWKESHDEVSMREYEEMAEDFKMKYVYSHIGAAEHKDGAVALWLHSLNLRNYPDFSLADKDHNCTPQQ